MGKSIFTLVPGRWYAWEMIPGYSEELDPYHSPILVQGVEPLKKGTGEMRLSFFNAFYAQGVQNFTKDLRVMKRAEKFLVADLLDGPGTERAAVIGNITLSWLERYAPGVLSVRPLAEFGKVGGSGLDDYLNWAFRMTPRPRR